MKLKKPVPISQNEYVINFISKFSRGEIIIDENYYMMVHKKLEKLLKGCTITLMAVRRKNYDK